MKFKQGLSLSLATAAVLVLSACGKQEAPPAPKTEAPKPVEQPPVTVKIGHVAPLTGGIAHLGKDNENGARLAIEEANAAGVTLGGRKVKFELLAEDDQADPKAGTTVAQKLVDAKVAGVVGHLNSGTTIPLRHLRPRRVAHDYRGGHQSQAHRAGFQGRVPDRRTRRSAGPGGGQLPREPGQTQGGGRGG